MNTTEGNLVEDGFSRVVFFERYMCTFRHNTNTDILPAHIHTQIQTHLYTHIYLTLTLTHSHTHTHSHSRTHTDTTLTHTLTLTHLPTSFSLHPSPLCQQALKVVHRRCLDTAVLYPHHIHTPTYLPIFSLHPSPLCQQALKVVHRRSLDTAVLYPHPRGYPLRLKLKTLAADYLHIHIQKNNSGAASASAHNGATPSCGHDSVEDASTAMRLTLLKMEQGS